MTRRGDIVGIIKQAVDPHGFDLTKAEGRADFDDALRFLLALHVRDDETLLRHARAMLRDWREELFREAMAE